MKEIFIYDERSLSWSSSGRWLVPTGAPISSPQRADQVALARLLPVSLLYSLSETLISSSSAISPRSNTPSLSVSPYTMSYQSVYKSCMNAPYLATNYKYKFLRFLDHMTIRRDHTRRFVHSGDVLVQGIMDGLHRCTCSSLGRDFSQLYERGSQACQSRILLPRSVDNGAHGNAILCGRREHLDKFKCSVLICVKLRMCFGRIPVYPIMLTSVPLTTLWSMSLVLKTPYAFDFPTSIP